MLEIIFLIVLAVIFYRPIVSILYLTTWIFLEFLCWITGRESIFSR